VWRGAARRSTGRAISCPVEALGVWASVIESELRLRRRRTLNLRLSLQCVLNAHVVKTRVSGL